MTQEEFNEDLEKSHRADIEQLDEKVQDNQ